MITFKEENALRRDLVLFCASVFLLVLGTYIAGTILTPYAESLGATSLWLALITSGLYIVRLFIGVPIGNMADRKGTITVLTYSLILYPFIAVAYWLAFNPVTLLGARLLHGLASAMMLPMAMAYIGEASPINQEGYYMGIYNTMILMASGVGPQIATLITSHYGLRATFLALFVLALIALMLVFVLRNNFRRASLQVKSNEIPIENRKHLWENNRLMALSAVNIAMAVVLSLMGFFFIKFPLSKGINVIWIGTLIALYNIVTGLIQIPLGKVIDRWDKYGFIIVSGVLLSLLLISFPLCNRLWIMILFILILGLLSAIVLAASSALSTILGRSIGMNATMGFLGTASSSGMVLGCFLLSIAPGHWGQDLVFFISGAFFIAGIVVFAVLWKRESNIEQKVGNTHEQDSF